VTSKKTDDQKWTEDEKVHNQTLGTELTLLTVGNANASYQQATRRNAANLNDFA
jgi:hypothetical protein